jgi:hypothetical protein
MKISTRTRPRITSAHLVAIAALVVAMAGSATAAAMITGADIKNATITSKDVKDRSLKAKDLKKSELKKLRGKQGPAGATGPVGPQGPAGASAFGPPPSGALVVGGGIVDEFISSVNPSPVYAYAPLPFRASTPFVRGTARNVWYADSASVVGSETNPAVCSGTYAAPDPTPGHLCLYVVDADVQHVDPRSAAVAPGVSIAPDGADSTGVLINFNSAASPNQVRFPFVWAYRAP